MALTTVLIWTYKLQLDCTSPLDELKLGNMRVQLNRQITFTSDQAGAYTTQVLANLKGNCPLSVVQ